MKKMVKKLSALLMAVIMVLAMSATAFATGGLPTSDDRGKVTIQGIASGDVVNIYKIVKANYNDQGFIGYEAVVKDSIKELTAPTTAEIAELAKNESLTLTKTGTSLNDSITFENLEIGMYLVKINAVDPLTVYNPMVVSVHYSPTDNDMILDGNVSAKDEWEIKGTTAYAKSSTNTTPDKNIVDETGEIIVNGDGAGKGDAVAKGDVVNYKISGTVPSYSKEYFDAPTYTITDTLSDGLDFAEGTQTKVQSQVDEKYGVNKATVTVEGRTLTIDFSDELIWSIANSETARRFEFTYSAVLNGTSVNFDASTNSIYVTYDKIPGESTSTTPVETHNYTFAFNGEVKKVNEKGEVLKDAKFDLFKDPECKEPAVYGDNSDIEAQFSDENGEFGFTGLDDTTYYLKETVAPDGYQLNNTVYEIKITADYNVDGTLKTYTVSVRDYTNNGEATTTTYGKDGEGTVVVVGEKVVTEIKNTKLSSLPSTGGIGTTIFTIGGCVIMIVAAGLYFSTRKKEEN